MRWYLIGLLILAMGLACSQSDATSGEVTVTPSGLQDSEPVVGQGEPAQSDATSAEVTVAPSGLQYSDLVVGTGEPARVGATAVVHYTGWLVDGTKFDSSVDRGTPFNFVLGQRQVIQGWDEGVGSMRVGGKRKLTIPSDLAYGDLGAGQIIPPGATLVFEVELLEVR